jgi:hypothetical protein
VSRPAWEALADALLQREALLCRFGEGVPPRDLAGWFVAPEDVDRILRTLPGLDGPAPEVAAPLLEQLDGYLVDARRAFTTSMGGDSRLADLARRASLSDADAEALAQLAAVELHPQRQRLVGYIQDSVQLPRLTLATLDRILGSTAGALLVAPDAALRRGQLVDVEEQGPWAVRMCSVPPRVAWYLRGDAAPDRDLPPGTRRLIAVRGCRPKPDLLIITGADRETRLRAVQRTWPEVSVLLTSVPTATEGWDALVREATVTGSVVVLEIEVPLDPAARQVVERTDHLAWALSSVRELPLECLPRRPWRELSAGDGAADAADWRRALGRGVPPAYRLDREQLRLVASALQGGESTLDGGVRRLAAGHLDHLALRVTPSRGWEDLVLPRDQKQQLGELAARYRRRATVHRDWGFPALPSSGVVALFSGASGTGKTLAAEVIAGDLGLDLYKVDLAGVVSKYIGETEKNLSRIFDAAGASDLVLFFDEADALFGKRTEVSDSHDRYANIEVSYLLQRLERYDGLVIMATNLQRNIDTAFLRRIAVAVDFPLPGEPQRRDIWRRSIPRSAPQDDLDLDFLAHNFKISGGVIHNATLGAAFLAADDGQVITMEHVALALKREFQKLGRLRTEAEFERYYDLVNRDDDAEPAR